MNSTKETRSVDRDALKLLIQELGDLYKSLDGESDAAIEEFLWPQIRVQYKLDKEDVQPAGLRSMKASRFSEVMRGTYKLKNLTSLLGLLHLTAKQLLDKTEPNIRSHGNNFGRLLQELPDELLMKTLKLASDRGSPQQRVYSMLTLSHVNKRFRSVAHQAVDVWATVSSETHLALTELCLNWSKNAKLNVDVTAYAYPIDGFMGKILPFASRWKELSFRCSDYTIHSETLGKITGLHLPNLESLFYEFDEFKSDRKDSLDHIYLSWNAPKLRSITFAGIAPKFFPNSSIVAVRIAHWIGVYNFISSLHEYQSFLCGSPTVENLQIACDIRPEQQWSTSNFPRLRLENIRTVEVECTFHVWSIPERVVLEDHPICHFIQSLDLPNLERLSIFVQTFTSRYFDETEVIDMDVTGLMFALTPSPRLRSPVKHLNLCVQGTRNSRFFKNMLTVPLERFPALRSLSVDIEGVLELEKSHIIQKDASASNVFPTIDRLEMQKCWGGALEFLRGIIERTKNSGGASRASPTVVVKHCPFVRRDDLVGFAGKLDLVYEEAVITERLQTLLKSCGLSLGAKSAGG